MSDEITLAKMTKTRKKLGPIELYSLEGDQLTKLGLQPPQTLKSSDAMERWIHDNAEVDGTYVFLRRIVGVKVKKTQVVQTTTERV